MAAARAFRAAAGPYDRRENLQIRVASAITRAPAARLIKGCRGGGDVLQAHPLIYEHFRPPPPFPPPLAGEGREGGCGLQESQMPKIKTKSGAKKRFKVTGSGKVLYTQSRKRHGMIKRTKKQIRQLRGTNVLFKTDGDNVKKYFLPNG
jgi:large subunit ribosomal protein L35